MTVCRRAATEKVAATRFVIRESGKADEEGSDGFIKGYLSRYHQSGASPGV